MAAKKSKAKPKKAAAAKKAKPKKKTAGTKRPAAKPAKKAVKKAKKATPKPKARATKKAVKKATPKPKARVTRKAVKKTAPKPKARATKKAVKKAKKATPKPKARVTRKAVKKAPPKPKARATKKTPEKKAKKATPKPKATGKAAAKATPAGMVTVKPAPAPAAATKGTKKKGKSRRRSSRRQIIRRGPDGEILAPGDLLLPGGAKGEEEIGYLFRGCMAAEHPVADEAIEEILTKRGVPEGPGEREELQQALGLARERFGGGDVEPVVPVRSNLKKTFQGVVERARQRRREIGAFLRGLDMGHTETSHMDAHGEASLQSVMEWAARLENLVENLTETPEMNQAHYTQFHRVLDQLEATTEALVVDVEQTLRRLRDRLES